ncbi:P-loop containing nucleoside triphosphate hydrolase protein [Dioscorea alata]|uniref:P-loop containing nucleoside triphosphate hydrolase protein n=2 Tax=Dioscorea alata TaxID=55571 RepID=A0ACB7U8M7_DIOAL|nr:P-loop containing nucleoside triphosphate hydrolase protein [Dioscorea alata]KAH7656679.1 P-loop containing nucleoside triphosphate hydrolase protein [Dioscorea alata]
MVSATLAGITGAILAPLLPHALDKLISCLVEYLSRDEPSSSSEVDKHEQLENEQEALEDANIKLKIMQDEVRKLHKRDKKNMRLIRINNKLRDVSYEIQDLEADLEYMELQRKVEEINLQDEAADMSQSKRPKRLFWFSWITGQSSNKRRRLSSSVSTDDIVNRMRSIVKQINCIDSEMTTEIKVDQLFQQIALNGVYDPWGQHQVKKNHGRETTSSIKERKIYGRDEEIESLTELLTKPVNCVGNISVVSISGMGGIGKTALAEFVFNSQEIQDHFDKRVWICVTDNYDRFRIIKEIIDLLSIDDDFKFPHDTTSLDLLETKLKRSLTGKKFLLVLDDVWSAEWQQLLDSLRSAEAEIVKILVTCRNHKALGSQYRNNASITLGGLSDEECWSFFLNCVFADENSDNYPKKILSTGWQIMKKLNGSPLAVKTVGRTLGRSLTEKYWQDLLKSDLWKLKNDENDIMSVLALSYYHLPQHLQLCFAFCSVFPKNCKFDELSVIDMWIAHGYVHENGSSSKTMRDIGREYYAELVAMGLFNNRVPFKMHNLIHDLAHSISHGEIYICEGQKDEKISKNVRHLCARSLFDLGSVCKTNNLRTLVLHRADDMCAFLNHGAFKRIRVLVILDTNMEELPETISNLKHLQYLDLQKTNIKSVPKSMCALYQLKVLKLPHQYILPSQFDNLMELREWNVIRANNTIHSMQDWPIFRVKKGGNNMISQLRNMNELRGSIAIEGLENIETVEEGMKAKLKEKCHIYLLTLSWKDSVDGCKHDVQEEVLEGLQPQPNLNHLCIDGYMGSKSPSWLMILQKLQTLFLIECKNWARLPAALGLLPSLETLRLSGIENITIEGDDTVTHMFTSLQSLALKKATVSFEGMSLSSSSSSSSLTTASCRKLFPHLQSLIVEKCDGVNGLPWQMLSSLKTLEINDSRGLQGQVPGCLQNLNSLISLEIKGLKIENTNMRAQQQQRGGLVPNLQLLNIECCENMGFLLDVLLPIPSLKILTISKCGSPVSLSALGHLSFLTDISLEEVQIKVEDVTPVFPSLQTLTLRKASMKVIVEDVTPVFPSLRTLTLEKASMIFQNISASSSLETTQNLNHFPKLTNLTIACHEVNGLHWPLFHGLDDHLLPGCLNAFSALTYLQLIGAKFKTFHAELMATPNALRHLYLQDCNELISVEGLHALPSLGTLSIIKCSQFRTLSMEQITEHGVFLPKLSYIYIWSCENLESLPAWVPRLPLLKSLSIIKCPKFHSLPEGGLPSSLQRLEITKCDTVLMERCQQEGSSDWLMIEHIPEQIYK